MPESTLLIVRRLTVLADFGRSREEMRWWARSNPDSGYQVSAFRGNPADGGWPDPRRAPARGLRRHAAEPGSFSNPFSSAGRSRGTGAAAARGRHRPGQGRIDPAAVGRRQCRRRGAVDEERRRDGAGGIPESQHPASDQGRRRQPARRAARERSRRSTKAPRSSSVRCLRCRCRRRRSWRARAAYR